MGRSIRAAVVGAGVSGICALQYLRSIPGVSCVVFEKAPSVGGTWRDNTYPGVACDLPSRYYSFSFGPVQDWSRSLASGEEILTYIEGNLPVGVPLGSAALALLAGDEPCVQRVAQHDLQVPERFEERRGEVAVPPVQRERGGGIAGARGQVGVQPIGADELDDGLVVGRLDAVGRRAVHGGAIVGTLGGEDPGIVPGSPRKWAGHTPRVQTSTRAARHCRAALVHVGDVWLRSRRRRCGCLAQGGAAAILRG
ncbi:NAD(P)-binding protein [Streptomyces murinus]|uniref:NAD(P)-binding protein n=1 Tax=Streptomyces murinus TaxID=33900 RepID=UPI0038293B94